MNQTFNLLFFIKKGKGKIKANGTAPIYYRITIDGIPKEISAKRKILPDHWDNKLQKVIGKSEEAKSLNSYLKTLEQEVYDVHHMMMKDKINITSSLLKARIISIKPKAHMLVPIFQDHNDKIEKLVGLEFAPGTLERYKTSLSHTKEFMQWKFKVSELILIRLTTICFGHFNLANKEREI